jgi:hypothetical protein
MRMGLPTRPSHDANTGKILARYSVQAGTQAQQHTKGRRNSRAMLAVAAAEHTKGAQRLGLT